MRMDWFREKVDATRARYGEACFHARMALAVSRSRDAKAASRLHREVSDHSHEEADPSLLRESHDGEADPSLSHESHDESVSIRGCRDEKVLVYATCHALFRCRGLYGDSHVRGAMNW